MQAKEIGGYLGFESYTGNMLYDSAIKLNLARNCLKYILISKHITEIYLPFYICESVVNACKETNVDIKFYEVDKNFHPILTGIKNKTVYIINYFGLLSNSFIKYLAKNNEIIVDNVQAYFQKPVKGIDTIYSCRKFFGVSDGALLFTNVKNQLLLTKDSSVNRITHLIGRMELDAESFFDLFKKNEDVLGQETPKLMSKFTENLLRSFDYAKIKRKRTQNYKYLHSQLKSINTLECKNIKGAYCYPLMLEDAQKVREYLIARKVYVPILWPNCLNLKQDSMSYKFAANILPIPCDQRYNVKDMKIIVDLINESV